MPNRSLSPIIILLIVGLATTITFGTAGLIRYNTNPFTKANVSFDLKNNRQVIDATKLNGATLITPVVGISQLSTGKYKIGRAHV